MLGEPAIKIFTAGSDVVYACEIYDGRGTRGEGFTTRATLLRDGKPFFTTPTAAIGARARRTPSRSPSVPVAGTVLLGRNLPRGTYTLQVSVSPAVGERPRPPCVAVGRLRSALMRRPSPDRGSRSRPWWPTASRAPPGGHRETRPPTAPATRAPGDQPTFRAGVRLATFDAVVTDDKGRHVTDLTAADFEVVERGKRQTVRQAAYVPTTGPPAATAPPTTTAPPDAMPGRAGLAVPERTARVLAIVVDDLMS